MSDRMKINTQSSKPRKNPRKELTLEIKHEVLKLHALGLKVHEFAYKFKLSRSTVTIILKDKAKYLREVVNAID
jgi:transcriptional antiterminator